MQEDTPLKVGALLRAPSLSEGARANGLLSCWERARVLGGGLSM